MNDIALQRCFNHQTREAVARCPECARFFCRECITEHDDRVVCAECLARAGAKRGEKKSRFRILALILQSVTAFMVVWLIFYYTGRGLLLLPSSFHEGTLWRELPWEED